MSDGGRSGLLRRATAVKGKRRRGHLPNREWSCMPQRTKAPVSARPGGESLEGSRSECRHPPCEACEDVRAWSGCRCVEGLLRRARRASQLISWPGARALCSTRSRGDSRRHGRAAAAFRHWASGDAVATARGPPRALGRTCEIAAEALPIMARAVTVVRIRSVMTIPLQSVQTIVKTSNFSARHRSRVSCRMHLSANVRTLAAPAFASLVGCISVVPRQARGLPRAELSTAIVSVYLMDCPIIGTHLV